MLTRSLLCVGVVLALAGAVVVAERPAGTSGGGGYWIPDELPSVKDVGRAATS
jgi:hypothetical protein